jgi:predicted amidophosphoribosyltransferase
VLRPPWCDRCGRPGPADVASCGDCPPDPVARARAPFLYDGPARAAILRLKFAGWRGVARALAGAMTAEPLPAPVDVVTWVPLARGRLAERGFDQARSLAVAVGDRLELPVLRLAHRRQATGPQARRSGEARRRAMAGAFVPSGRRAAAHVLLVDDVLTTGATAAACAGAIREAGAREVTLLAAARAFDRAGGRGYTRVGSRPGLWLPGDPPR